MVLSDFEVWRVLWRRQSTTSRSSSSRSSISSSSNKLSSIGTPLTRAASTSPSGESAPPQASSRPFSSALLVSGVWGVNKWNTKKSTFYQTNNVWVPEGGGGGREGGWSWKGLFSDAVTNVSTTWVKSSPASYKSLHGGKRLSGWSSCDGGRWGTASIFTLLFYKTKMCKQRERKNKGKLRIQRGAKFFREL